MEIQLTEVLANNGLTDPDRKHFGPKGTKPTLAERRPAQRKAFSNRQARPYSYGKPWSKHIWLTGRLKSIDDATFFVAPELPDASDMKGLGFIRAAAGADCRLSLRESSGRNVAFAERKITLEQTLRLDDLARTNLNALTQWINDAKLGTVHKFTVGDDVELFLNGREAEPNNFVVGDFVGVWYDLNSNPTSDAVKPVQIRASRMAIAERPLDSELLVPIIDGDWWQVAGNPDLGDLTSPKQEPVDFCIWQAADGTWQLWSCIRKANCGGNTRLFHGWEGRNLTDKNWKPLGIVMRADPKFGESPGGLQAPHVIRHEDTYYMFYGDWANICMATSTDGKKFTRVVQGNGKTALFNEGGGEHARDAMILKVGDRFHCYYTAHSTRSPEKNHRGVNYCRISSDLRHWGQSQVVAEGSVYGKGPYCAECPHVVFHTPSKDYYLFNTQRYGRQQHTTVFLSRDPLHFGITDRSDHIARRRSRDHSA